MNKVQLIPGLVLRRRSREKRETLLPPNPKASAQVNSCSS